MTDDIDDVLAELKADIEQRISEQLVRHSRIDPNADRKQVIRIQIEQERERLKQKAVKLENEGKNELAEFCHLLADEWLPGHSKKLCGD